MKLHGTIISVLFLCAGCMRLGPDYKQPDMAFEVPQTYRHDISESFSYQPQDRWWEEFGDADLNDLVQQVIRHNWDIKKATARVLEVRSQFVQTRSDRFPSLTLKGDMSRQKSVGKTTSAYGLSLPATFEWDLWGRLAREEEAASADLLTAEENRKTVMHTVIAEAASLYLQMEALERFIQITKDTIASYRYSVKVVEGRYRRGLTSVLDLRQARRALAGAESGLPSLRQDLGAVQQRLAVLSGRYPETQPERLQPEIYFKQLSPVPPGLPSDLLLRRPDVRSAEAQLVALNARIGVAKARRFPAISLTGNFGYASTELEDLFRPENELWSLAAGLTQPLFDAGNLKAGQAAAKARYDQGVATYAKTVLNAFSEVENALLNRKEQLAQRQALLQFLQEARAAQRVAEERYKKGLVDFLTVLVSQRTRFEAEESVVRIDLGILTNRVSLHRALGGGWGEKDAENSPLAESSPS
jgi:multidrug efflux system outer membrane protein